MECGHAPMTNVNKELVIDQATVFWTLDNTIYWIALYPVDNIIHFAITYPLDSDLSVGFVRYLLPFTQLGPEQNDSLSL